MNDKILITGAAGFIGLHLTRRLLDDGYQVHMVDNFARAVKDADLEQTLQHPAATFSSVDCLDAGQVGQLPTDFDYIFHLAAIIGVEHVVNRPFEVVVNNTNLLANLIDHARCQSKLKRFLFASTSEVYAGTLENFELPVPTPEQTPLSLSDVARPRTSYMLSKIAGEAMCHYSGLPFTIFRPHNVYGPRMGSAHVVPGQLRKAWEAADGDSIAVPSVDQTRCFCYIDDAVEMLVRMMTRSECENETLNLGTQEPEVTIRELAETCHRAVGRDVSLKPEPAPPGSPNRRAPDMSLTFKATGYRSEVSLDDGVTRTWQWYRTNVFEGAGVTAI